VMRASVVSSIKPDSAFRSLNYSDIRIEPDTALNTSPRPAFQFIDVTSKTAGKVASSGRNLRY
jgi:hypothetical protein